MLDVVGIEDGSQKEVVLGRGILEFRDRDHLRIRMGWEGTTRPLTFDGSSNNDTIELVRQPGN